MRIAVFCNGIFPFTVGGMQKFTTCSVNAMLDQGIKVNLFYQPAEGYPSVELIKERVFCGHSSLVLHPISVPSFPYFPGHYYFSCWRQSKAFAKAFIQSDCDCEFIYAHGYTGWNACQLRRSGLENLPPVGVHPHGIEALQEEFSLFRVLQNSFAPYWQRRLLKLADFNLSLGGKIDDLIGATTGRCNNILPAKNGIHSSWLHLSSRVECRNSPLRFLFVGRESERKGFIELTQVVRQLAVQDFDFEFHVVGGYKDDGAFGKAKIVCHGKVKDELRLREIYQDCDVLVVPSYSEGMPTVILEAMASGLAIIAADVGGIRMVVNSDVGELIEPKNTRSLHSAMVSFLSQPIAGFRRQAFQQVHEFTWEKVVAESIDGISTALTASTEA